MPRVTAPFPNYDPITTSARPLSQAELQTGSPREVNRQPGYLTDAWNQWLTDLNTRVDETAARIAAVLEDNQSASISATPLPLGSISAGLYRLTYYTRIITAASTSSSLTVELGWLDEGVAVAGAGAAITSNTVTSFQSNSIMVYADAVSPLTYATTYSSTGATAMVYKLWVIAENANA